MWKLCRSLSSIACAWSCSTRRQPSWPRMLRHAELGTAEQAPKRVQGLCHYPARLARAAVERSQRPAAAPSPPAGGFSSAIGRGRARVAATAATAAAAAAEGLSVPKEGHSAQSNGDGSAGRQGEPQSKQPIAMHTVMQEYLLAHSKEPQVIVVPMYCMSVCPVPSHMNMSAEERERDIYYPELCYVCAIFTH